MRRREANGREKIRGTQIIKVNLRALDGRGTAMKTAGFDIKVLHKSNGRKKGMARGGEGKKRRKR